MVCFYCQNRKIGGGTNEIETVKNQIKQSFEYSYDGIDGKEQKVNKVKVITNENFTEGAHKQLSSSSTLNIYNNNLSYWWNENLIELIDKYYSEFWFPDNLLQAIIDEQKKQIDDLQKQKQVLQTIIDNKITQTDELGELLKSNEATADNFFITRREKDKVETFESIVQSKPKKIKYSGGHLNKLISGMMTNDSFKNYVCNNQNVEVQFLFPNYNNDNVINNLVTNITTGYRIETYIIEIKNAVKKLSNFITEKNLNNRVEYRFYEFVPSFGLKIIEGGENNRLYVDLFTIRIEKDKRYQFKIEEKNSGKTYRVFKEQYDELWKTSKRLIY